MPKWIMALALLALAGGLLAAACGGDEEEESSGGDGRAAGTVSVELGDYYFDPTEFTAAPGETLTLKLANEGKAEHTFTVDSLQIDKLLKPGDEATVEITPAQAGALTYRCRFHGDSSNMTGTLTVGQGGAAGAGGSSTPQAPGGGYSGGY